jgi:hypothetical protein
MDERLEHRGVVSSSCESRGKLEPWKSQSAEDNELLGDAPDSPWHPMGHENGSTTTQ